MDTIERQDAIDVIHHTIYEFFDVVGDDEESPLTYKDMKLLELNKSISTRVKDLPSAPRWIPVTDGLPKPNEHEYGVQRYYLIQNEFGDMMVAAYRQNKSGCTWWEQMYAYKPVEDEVIAWMPLPKPYGRSEE